MKRIKLFMLMVAAVTFFASCSDDDKLNTEPCTVGFASATYEFSEIAGYVNVPINVSGHRNGPVRVTVEVSPTGSNPATEGEDFTITDKTLNLEADTLSSGTINVEVKIIDNYRINPDRQFTLTITSSDGAEIEQQTTTVTITDNDGNVYLGLGGTWTLTATSLNGTTERHEVRLIPVTNVNSPNYEKVMTIEASNLSGYNESISWDMTYYYDETTLQGRFSFEAGPESVGEYADQPLFWYLTPDNQTFYYGTVTATWEVGEDGSLPTTITFDPNAGIWSLISVDNGYLSNMLKQFSNVVLTRN